MKCLRQFTYLNKNKVFLFYKWYWERTTSSSIINVENLKKKINTNYKKFRCFRPWLNCFFNINSKFKRFNTNLKTTYKLIILLSCYVTYNFKLKIPITNTTTTRKQIQMLPYFWRETLSSLSFFFFWSTSQFVISVTRKFFFFFYFWHPLTIVLILCLIELCLSLYYYFLLAVVVNPIYILLSKASEPLILIARPISIKADWAPRSFTFHVSQLDSQVEYKCYKGGNPLLQQMLYL